MVCGAGLVLAPENVVSSMKRTELPEIITHANVDAVFEAVLAEPYFQPGPYDPTKRPAWVDMPVTLEFPVAELTRGALVLVGPLPAALTPLPLTGREGFAAQGGVEGKLRVTRPLFSALIAVRDVLPQLRGRILTREQKPARTTR